MRSSSFTEVAGHVKLELHGTHSQAGAWERATTHFQAGAWERAGEN